MGRSSGRGVPFRVLPESIPDAVSDRKGKEPLKVSSLPGSAMSFAAAELCTQHDGMLLVITEDTASAERMLSETADILGSDENLLCFPGYETLPYDSFAPRQDVISERAEALYFLRTSKKGAVFAAADKEQLSFKCTVKANEGPLYDLVDLELYKIEPTSAGTAK